MFYLLRRRRPVPHYRPFSVTLRVPSLIGQTDKGHPITEGWLYDVTPATNDQAAIAAVKKHAAEEFGLPSDFECTVVRVREISREEIRYVHLIGRSARPQHVIEAEQAAENDGKPFVLTDPVN